MSVPVIAFFNNKGGVGKTSLVYHLAWMLASELEVSVLMADLDPQSNLTAMALDEARLEELWPDGPHRQTVFGAIEPILARTGPVVEVPHVEEVAEGLFLLPGDLALASFEDEAATNWPRCLDGQEGAFRVISAFWRLIRNGAARCGPDVALVDLGPNLGAINRAAMVASDYVVTPIAADLFSLQGMRNSGPTLRGWRTGWKRRLEEWAGSPEEMPAGRMEPAGYVIVQRGERPGPPAKAYARWAGRIPVTFHRSMLGEDDAPVIARPEDDPACLGLVKHYRSLMPLAQDAQKPMFQLRSADGAIGAHQQYVLEAYRNFRDVARSILAACCGVAAPPGEG